MITRTAWWLAGVALCASAWVLPAGADAPVAPASKAVAAPAKPTAKPTSGQKKSPPSCLQATGTRIPLKGDECVAQGSRSWSRDDLDSTGASTTAGAMRQLVVH